MSRYRVGLDPRRSLRLRPVYIDIDMHIDTDRYIDIDRQIDCLIASPLFYFYGIHLFPRHNIHPHHTS